MSGSQLRCNLGNVSIYFGFVIKNCPYSEDEHIDMCSILRYNFGVTRRLNPNVFSHIHSQSPIKCIFKIVKKKMNLENLFYKYSTKL